MPQYTKHMHGVTTYLKAIQPNTTFNAELRSGQDNSNESNHGIIQFPGLNEIPLSAVVVSAVLTIKLGSEWSNSTQLHSIYRLKRAAITSQATWNNFSTGNAWQTAGGTGANDIDTTAIGSHSFSDTEAPDSTHAFTLTTAAIQEMVSRTFTNNGFLIRTPDTTAWTSWVFYGTGENTILDVVFNYSALKIARLNPLG